MTLDTPSDVTLLKAIGDPDRYRILIHLLQEPATQKQLAAALELSSGIVSKHMSVLEKADLARRGRSHSAYEPLFEDRLRALLRSVALLKLDIVDAKRETADDELQALTRAGIRVSEDSPKSETG